MTPLETLLTTHRQTIQDLLGPLPLIVWKVEQFGPLTKYTIGELPDGRWAMLHHLVEPDLGSPHDHPCAMSNYVLKGGYVEQVYHGDGRVEEVTWRVGSSHSIEPDCIHKIIHLPEGESWTLVFAGPVVRQWRHYDIAA